MDRLRSCGAVVFDLDGTLADTVGDLTAALNRTLADLDLPPFMPHDVRGMLGEGLGKLLDRGLARHDVALDRRKREAMFAQLVAHYAAAPCEHAALYPGARDTLVALSEAGIDCGVLTNKHEPIAHDVLRGLGIASAFRAVRGSESGFPRKPHPAGLLHLVETLGATPETTMLVGDSATDLKTGRAAGLQAVVLVTFGYSVTPVTELGADWVINHLHELVQGLALREQAQ